LRVDWHDAQARLTQKPTFVGDAAGASSAVPARR